MRRFLLANSFILLFCAVQAQIDPLDISGLSLWLKADAGVVVDGSNKVSEWQDQSPQSNHATQVAGTLQPLLVDEVLNGLPTVRMDGFNDYMVFPELLSIRHVFWVVKEDADATTNFRSLLGHNSSFDFIRGPDYNIWHPDFTNEGILSGTTRLNFSDVDGTATVLPSDFCLVSVSSGTDLSANQLTLERQFFTRVWDGDIAEVIVYEDSLTGDEIAGIENYLADKYTPDFSASEDIVIDYGFCDTLICASEGFADYLWSTGEETPCIEVNKSGEYIIEALDLFGRTRTDTVNVLFPGTLDFENVVICLGEDHSYETGLSTDDYDFVWSDGSEETSLTVTEEDEYSVQITDSLGCIVNSEVSLLDVDSISVDLSLGELLELCEGELLSLDAGSYDIDTYQWNTGSEDESIGVIDPGEYWVQVVDVNGCEFSDSVDVEISGTAPIVGYSVSSFCAGGEVIFTDTSLAETEIISTIWTLGAGVVVDLPEIEVLVGDAGSYTLSLEVTTQSGCSAMILDTLEFWPAPDVDFLNGLPCRNSEFTLVQDCNIDTGSIVQYDWIVNDDEYSGAEISLLLEEEESISVYLEAISDQGCIAEYDSLIQTLVTPEIDDIPIDGQCLGELTGFVIEFEEVSVDSVVFYDWDFGDLNTSFQPSPDHLYNSAGSYVASVTVVHTNGCSSEASTELEIYNLPEVEILSSFGCADQLNTLLQESDGMGAAIESFEWNIDGVGSHSGSSPEVLFSEVGLYDVSLEVITELGCQGEANGVIEVIDYPDATFAFSPEVAFPPVEVGFIANGDPSNLYSWNFGDGNQGEGMVTTHVYEEEGSYEVQLVMSNDFGCADTTYGSVLATQPLPDLVINELYLTPFDDLFRIGVSVTNQSNFTVSSTDLTWSLGNGPLVIEQRIESVAPGGSFIFEFSSLMDPTTGGDFVCVSVNDSDPIAPDISPPNNTHCEAVAQVGEAEILPIYPNPSDGNVTLEIIIPAPEVVDIQVFDASGRLVFDSAPVSLSDGFNRLHMDLSELAEGSYRTVVFLEDGQLERGFVIYRQE